MLMSEWVGETIPHHQEGGTAWLHRLPRKNGTTTHDLKTRQCLAGDLACDVKEAKGTATADWKILNKKVGAGRVARGIAMASAADREAQGDAERLAGKLLVLSAPTGLHLEQAASVSRVDHPRRKERRRAASDAGGAESR